MTPAEFTIECRVRRWAKWLFVASYACECAAATVKAFALGKLVRTVTLTRNNETGTATR